MTLRIICTIGIAIIVDTALTCGQLKEVTQRYLPNTNQDPVALLAGCGVW